MECNQDGSEHAVRKRLSGQVRSGAAVRTLAAEDKQTLATLGRKDGMDRSGSKLDVQLELRLQPLET